MSPEEMSRCNGLRAVPVRRDALLGQAAEDAPPQRLNDVLAPQPPRPRGAGQSCWEMPRCTGAPVAGTVTPAVQAGLLGDGRRFSSALRLHMCLLVFPFR